MDNKNTDTSFNNPIVLKEHIDKCHELMDICKKRMDELEIKLRDNIDNNLDNKI